MWCAVMYDCSQVIRQMIGKSPKKIITSPRNTTSKTTTYSGGHHRNTTKPQDVVCDKVRQLETKQSIFQKNQISICCMRCALIDETPQDVVVHPAKPPDQAFDLKKKSW